MAYTLIKQNQCGRIGFTIIRWASTNSPNYLLMVWPNVWVVLAVHNICPQQIIKFHIACSISMCVMLCSQVLYNLSGNIVSCVVVICVLLFCLCKQLTKLTEQDHIRYLFAIKDQSKLLFVHQVGPTFNITIWILPLTCTRLSIFKHTILHAYNTYVYTL